MKKFSVCIYNNQTNIDKSNFEMSLLFVADTLIYYYYLNDNHNFISFVKKNIFSY